MKSLSILSLVVASSAFLMVTGCSQPKATVTSKVTPYRDQNINLVKPNYIVVHKPAVTPQQIRALQPIWYPKDGADRNPSEIERSIGDKLSAAIQSDVVARLNAAHIEAYAEGAKDETSFKTGVLQGYFFAISSANAASHDLGFNLDKNTYHVRFLANVKEVPIAEMTYDVTESRLHDIDDNDMPDRTNREAAAIAKKIVDEAIVPAYKQRGWLK